MGNKTSQQSSEVANPDVNKQTSKKKTDIRNLAVNNKTSNQTPDIKNVAIHKKHEQEILCYGYIRAIEPELAGKIIPDNIAQICFQYFLYVE